MSFLKIQNVCKNFGPQQVLKNINLEIGKGSKTALLGASGSGKSTLLYLIGGLDQPTSGTILYNEENLALKTDESLANYRNNEVGFIFQFHFLLPSMKALDNILLPAKIGGKDTEVVQKSAISLAYRLGVSHCLKKYPFELSGGEQQRINIIRALSLNPKLLLCDEPTGNLDSQNSKNVMGILFELASENNLTLIVVTHDEKIANTLESKIIIEDGHIIS